MIYDNSEKGAREVNGETVTRVNEGIELIQKPGGQMFGTDALLLAAFAEPAPAGRAAELGAGSGIISLLAARRGKYAHVDAIEIQPETADLAGRNAALNGLDGRITVINADLREYRAGAGEYAAVFANPPYMRDGAGRENPDPAKNAARREVYGGIGDFCACAARLLNFGGGFYCVWRPDRLCDLLAAMRESGIEPKRLIYVYPDRESPPCLLLCEGRRGGRPGSLWTAPPFILTEGGAQTAECEYVYERGEFGERYKKR